MYLNRIKRLIRIIRENGFMEGVRAVSGFVGVSKIWRDLIIAYLKLKNKDNLILRNIQGSKMYLDLSDPGISRELIFRGIHEKLATNVLRQELKRGMVVIDIGANLGYYALLEASIVGKEGHVYAIEPVRKNFDILCKNIHVNGYENIKAYCIAISSKSGTAEMTLTEASNWHCMLDVTEEVVSSYMKQKMSRLARETVIVNTITLDEFLVKEKINKVDLIRMDIEGYEIEAIKGMLNTLKNTLPPLKLFFEIHNKVFNDLEKTIGPLLRQLLSFGFKPKVVILPHKILKDVSKDNFIKMVCSYKDICPHVLLEK